MPCTDILGDKTHYPMHISEKVCVKFSDLLAKKSLRSGRNDRLCNDCQFVLSKFIKKDAFISWKMCKIITVQEEFVKHGPHSINNSNLTHQIL